jgi:hypothetical protein
MIGQFSDYRSNAPFVEILRKGLAHFYVARYGEGGLKLADIVIASKRTSTIASYGKVFKRWCAYCLSR